MLCNTIVGIFWDWSSCDICMPLAHSTGLRATLSAIEQVDFARKNRASLGTLDSFQTSWLVEAHKGRNRERALALAKASRVVDDSGLEPLTSAM